MASVMATSKTMNEAATVRSQFLGPNRFFCSQNATGKQAACSAMTRCQPWTGTGASTDTIRMDNRKDSA